MRLAFCIPCRATVFEKSFASIATAIIDATASWAKLGAGNEITLLTAYRSHAAWSRNYIAEKALEYETDWTLWLDDDAVPPPDTFRRLWAHGKDFVVPVHRLKRRPYICPAAEMLETDEGTIKRAVDIDPPRLARITMAGMHCALIKTEIIRAVWDKTKGKPFQVLEGLGEDCFFYVMANQLGYESWMDTSFEVDHCMETTIGQMMGTVDE